MMSRRILLILLIQTILVLPSVAGSEELAIRGFEDLPFHGKWVAWSLEQNAPSTNGLVSMEFRPNETHDANMECVIWEVINDGKRTSRFGSVTVERSANLLHPSSFTYLISIKPREEEYPRDSAIHLVNVRITEDQQFPSGTVVLHFSDGFYSEMLLVKEKSANQKLQPTVKTPVELGKDQGTAAEL